MFQILSNCGKKCNGTRAKLNRLRLAELNRLVETMHFPSFLFIFIYFLKPISLPPVCVAVTSRPAGRTDSTPPDPPHNPGDARAVWPCHPQPSKQGHVPQHRVGAFRPGHFGHVCLQRSWWPPCVWAAQKPWGALFAQSLPSFPPCPVSLGAPVPKAARPCPPGSPHRTDEEAGMGWVMPPQSLSVPWGAQGVPPALG